MYALNIWGLSVVTASQLPGMKLELEWCGICMVAQFTFDLLFMKFEIENVDCCE